ncbi:dUTP diphosphatase [Alteribacillus sp. HJP-4]|uniref:dUTP diphosphatase n=1 Tax=Alteribacillus sp. HJP-4 TaxID=2775394 RepID=UPI0035CD33C3
MDTLFAIQKKLDDRILKEHHLNREDLFHDKVLALQVETAELANETRCFKYWSKKPASPRETILEEYVDGLHFILSLGIDGGWPETPEWRTEVELPDATTAFLAVFENISLYAASPSNSAYKEMFSAYLELGRTLNFSTEEIKEAYLSKNEKNHIRQEEGY